MDKRYISFIKKATNECFCSVCFHASSIIKGGTCGWASKELYIRLIDSKSLFISFDLSVLNLYSLSVSVYHLNDIIVWSGLEMKLIED